MFGFSNYDNWKTTEPDYGPDCWDCNDGQECLECRGHGCNHCEGTGLCHCHPDFEDAMAEADEREATWEAREAEAAEGRF